MPRAGSCWLMYEAEWNGGVETPVGTVRVGACWIEWSVERRNSREKQTEARVDEEREGNGNRRVAVDSMGSEETSATEEE